MELLLTGAIVSLGAMFSQDTKEKEDKKKFFAKVPLNKKPNGENIYQSNRSYDIFESEWKNSGPLYKKSMNTKDTNVVFGGPPNYPNFLNKVDYADKQLPVEFNSTMSYDQALLDVQDVRTSANQVNDLAKNNMSKPEVGGWSGISLTGEQINPNNFTHNNMQPFFGGNLTQNTDEFATRGIFENFTGDMDSYQHKKEQGLFFEPQKNMGNVYGASNLDGYMLDRYYVSNVRSNETPVEKVYVAPNLNAGYNASGQGAIRGNGDIEARDYAMPKTTNELRVKTDPKISYYGRIISGAHVAKPGKIGTLYKNRPDTYYVNSPERYFTTTGAVEAPAARPCQVLKYTNRKTTELKTRVNSAAPVHGSKGVVRSKYKVSNKVTYANDSVRNATVEGQWSILGMLGLDKTPNDYGKKSIRMRPNARTDTGSKTAVLNVRSSVSKGEARNGQKAKRTMKEVTENNKHNGNLQSGQPGRGFVYDPNDKARTTMRQVYEQNDHNGNLQPGEPARGFVYDPNDIARTTTKETTEDNDYMGQLDAPNRGFVYDPNDKARSTMKETTEDNDYMGQLDAPNRGVVYDPNDIARTTIKETQIDNNHSGQMNAPKRGFVYDPNDVARTTMKELNENNEHMGNMDAPNRGVVYDPEDYRFRTTTKEIYEANEHNGHIGNSQKRLYTSAGNPLKVTTKQTTMANDVMGIASGMERNDGYLVKEVNAPVTHRETTNVSYMTNANKNISGGYEVTDVQMPGTNRMFSVEYTGNVGNTNDTANPMSYTDAYNGTMRAVRDIQDKGYTPNAMAPNTTIDPSNIHATTSRIGDVQNKYIQERGVMPSVISNSIPQMSECNLTQGGDRVPNEPIADRLNPNILNAFRSNPYTQSLSAWA